MINASPNNGSLDLKRFERRVVSAGGLEFTLRVGFDAQGQLEEIASQFELEPCRSGEIMSAMIDRACLFVGALVRARLQPGQSIAAIKVLLPCHRVFEIEHAIVAELIKVRSLIDYGVTGQTADGLIVPDTAA